VPACPAHTKNQGPQTHISFGLIILAALPCIAKKFYRILIIVVNLKRLNVVSFGFQKTAYCIIVPLGFVWMHVYSSQSTCVEVDWSGIKLNFILFHSNTCRLKGIHMHPNKGLIV
jgi:hypothetical protein